MLLGMPWLERHDPTIDWEKRTVVRFGHPRRNREPWPYTPNGAYEPPSKTVARAAVSDRSARSASCQRLRESLTEKECLVPDQTLPESSLPRRGNNSVSALGVATHCSTVRRRGDDNASTPGVDATSCVDGCKRPALKLQPGCTKQGAIKPGLMTRARGYKNPPAVARRLECLPAVSKKIRPWPGLDEMQVNPGFTRRSDGSSTRHSVSLGPGPRLFKPQEPTVAVETLNVLTRAGWVPVQENGVRVPST
ncbi:reverse transcriptase, partial [Phytophthora megakarya]